MVEVWGDECFSGRGNSVGTSYNVDTAEEGKEDSPLVGDEAPGSHMESISGVRSFRQTLEGHVSGPKVLATL